MGAQYEREGSVYSHILIEWCHFLAIVGLARSSRFSAQLMAFGCSTRGL